MKGTMIRRCLILIISLVQCARIYAQVELPDNMVNPDCSTEAEAMVWGIEQGGVSQALSHMYAQPFVGDLDGDGEVEILTAGFYNDAWYSSSVVIYGSDLRYKGGFTTPQMRVCEGYPIAVADVDGDGMAEVYVQCMDGYLRCYHADGTWVWSSYCCSLGNRSPALMIGDVNGDGIPEVWSLGRIFNAVTGSVLLDLPEVVGGSLMYSGNRGSAVMPVFADFDGDGNLELAGGNKVYKLVITNTTGTSGNSVTLWRTIAGTGIGDGLTSVADLDLDGKLDVVVVQRDRVYAWSPTGGAGNVAEMMGVLPYSSTMAGSRALLADVDGNGYPEIVYTSAERVSACRYDTVTGGLVQMWESVTSDLSGATTMSAFDFDQDGQVEIVYRDESDMRIIDGSTGQNKVLLGCMAPTAVEGLAVVDLDGDGEAEIVTSTSTYDNTYDRHASVVVFRSPAGVKWAPARRVWNQHGYNVVNVNNDLTIPSNNFNPATSFAGPDGVVRRPFNNFLQQGTMLDMHGRPFMLLANVAITSDTSIIIDNNDVVITYRFCNTGGIALNAPYYITYYANTYQGPVIRVETVNTPLLPDNCMLITVRFTEAELSAFEGLNSIVVSLNDNRNGIAQPGGQQQECDITDNLISFSLELCPPRQSTVIADVCLGDSYVDENFDIAAEEISEAREYQFSRVFPIGSCDSVVLLKLRVHAESHHRIVETISQNSNYDRYGLFIPQEDLLDRVRIDTSVVLQSIYGCDSILHFTLTVAVPEIELYLPNAITTNKDGQNDVFSISEWTQSQILDIDVRIFNRRGELVYYSLDKDFKWDGYVKGKVYHNNVYVYIIRYTNLMGEKVTKKGAITVL